ncbi:MULTISPECIES: hypothetical protein [unclassified Streptomyces]|uniref:hypothetical protein n=1 Tax=unclassified Streptomyces TaxID=2593676 RepID=UPI0036E21A00
MQERALFEVDRHVQARPRVYEDRYQIHQRGFADPIEYVAGLNVSRGRVERTSVEYGNSGRWISAHVVDYLRDREGRCTLCSSA